MKRNIKQGEIYMVNLGENNVGSEEKGVRPCVIISAEMLNKNRNNVTPIVRRPSNRQISRTTYFPILFFMFICPPL